MYETLDGQLFLRTFLETKNSAIRGIHCCTPGSKIIPHPNNIYMQSESTLYVLSNYI